MEIIKASKKHLNQVVKIYQIFAKSNPPGQWDKESLLKKIKKGEIFLAVEKNKVLGSIDLIIYDFCCEIEGISVLREFQRQGIGRKLVCFAEKYARERNCHKIWCWSKLKRKVKPFWLKNDFYQEGFLKKHWGKYDYFIFVKLL